jgi:transcriptional regulator with XRE-family HTH domain
MDVCRQERRRRVMGKIVNKLKEARLQRALEVGDDLTVSDVARAIGVSRQRLWKFEQDPYRVPRGNFLARLCEYYNVEPGILVEYIIAEEGE